MFTLLGVYLQVECILGVRVVILVAYFIWSCALFSSAWPTNVIVAVFNHIHM